MCGIVGGTGEPSDAAIAAIAHRGPDGHGVVRRSRFWLGHTRLAVIDTTSASDQPFERGGLSLAYNGELWNYRELRAEMEQAGERFATRGDTEVVAAALLRWGNAALDRFEGMFAMAWVDPTGRLSLARDRFGEVPLHFAHVGDRFRFASEAKALLALGFRGPEIRWVEPGSVTFVVDAAHVACSRWYDVPAGTFIGTHEDAALALRPLLERGVADRAVSDVGACLLLSGGLDSSAVAAMYRPHSRDTEVVAYVAKSDGAEKSRDLRAAREVAESLSIRLIEVRVPAPSASDLSEVVRVIEQTSKAQVEIGWACLKLADAIRGDGWKVVLSGEGSDELWGSYGFSFAGIERDGFRAYREQLFIGQHRKNFARCNKVFMSRGVECRLPFLSTRLVEHALSMTAEQCANGRTGPDSRKDALRAAVADLVPDVARRRAKMAFQEGAGLREMAASAVADPARYYRAEHARIFGGMEP